MRKQHECSKNSLNYNDNLVAGITAVHEEMSVMEDRIVSAVQRATSENGDNSTIDSDVTDGSKRKANSGPVGTWLASQNNKKGKKTKSNSQE